MYRLSGPARVPADTLKTMATTAPPGSAASRGDGTDWLVPRAPGPVSALVRLPGSKSMTNRALILAALSRSATRIRRPLVARDTQLMAAALRSLGARIDEAGPDETGSETWLVTPAPGAGASRPGGPAEPGRPVEIDVGNAGTALRFLPAVAALSTGDVTFRGDPRVSKRPVGPLLTALRQLGARISDQGDGAVPFVVHGTGSVPGGTVTLDASSSSQLISGLLLAAPRFGDGAFIRHEGPSVPSAPHIEMSVRMLRAAGCDVRTGADAQTGPGPGMTRISGDAGLAQKRQETGADTVHHAWRVFPGPISPGQLVIEPDLSNAVPFLAAALATGGEVTVADWPRDSLQPAARIIDVLTAMGARVSRTADGLRVSGSGRISGIGADLSAVGELTPVLTVLAALADSPSEFTGIGHLRTHESDRLAALAGEIGKLGGEVTELADGLAIKPRPLRADGVVFDSHDDHRLVMAAAVLGLVTGGLRVRNAVTVGKTFPGFPAYWARTLAPAG